MEPMVFHKGWLGIIATVVATGLIFTETIDIACAQTPIDGKIDGTGNTTEASDAAWEKNGTTNGTMTTSTTMPDNFSTMLTPPAIGANKDGLDEPDLQDYTVLMLSNIYPDNAIYTGQTKWLEFVANFSKQTTFEGTWLSIFASDDEPMLAFSRLGDVTVGKGLLISETDWKENPLEVHRTQKFGVRFTTGIHLSLGQVSHISAQNDDDDLLIRIKYEIVCVVQGGLEIGDEITASAYVNYNHTYYHLDKVPFLYNGTKSVDGEPSIVVDNVTEIHVLQPLTFGVSLFLPYPSSDVFMSVGGSQRSSSTNMDTGGLTVLKIQGRSVGSAFNYSVFPENLTALGYDTCPLKSSLSLTAGPLVNRDSLLDKPANDSGVVVMDITVLLGDTELSSSEVSVVISVNVNDVMLAVQVQLEVKISQSPPGVSQLTYPVMTLDSPAASDISTGIESQVQVAIATPELSNQTYTLHVITKPEHNNSNATLKIVAVTPVFYGKNIACENTSANVDFYTVIENGPVGNNYEFKFNLFNIGVHTGTDVNLLTFNVTVIMIGMAMEGNTNIFQIVLQETMETAVVNFTVDKDMFDLSWVSYSAFVTVGFPGFARLTIHSLPGIDIEYNVSVRTYATIYNIEPIRILTVNVIKIGSNIHARTLLSDSTVRLSSSLNSSIQDIGKMQFTVINTGKSSRADANTLELEIVVMKPKMSYSYYDNVIQADVNSIGKQTLSMYGVLQMEAYEGSPSISIITTCPDAAYYPGMTVTLLLHVTTNPESTNGPFDVFIPMDSKYMFVTASVISKGRNVVCVNVGQISPIERSDNTVLNFPLVCNRPRAHSDDGSDDDNTFVIEIKLQLAERDGMFSSPDEFTLDIGVSTNSMEQTSHTIPIKISAPRDLGDVKVVKTIRLSEPNFNREITNVLIQWSLDGVKYRDRHSLNSHFVNHQTSGTFEFYRLVARYLQVIDINQHCIINFTEETSTNGLPFIHGPANNTFAKLKTLLYALDAQSYSECQRLQSPGQTNSPFLWIDFKRSFFKPPIGGPFNVHVHGVGLQCSSRTGPHISMVAFPKHNSRFVGENHHQLCEVENEHLEYYCQYRCDCHGEEECSSFTLIMMHTGTDTEYKLCSLYVSQIFGK